jgi:hypothetical protein
MNGKSCCHDQLQEKNKGIWAGLLYGLVPHTFCIAFIVLSVIGVTTATVFLKKLLILPYFFQILIGLSIFFATLSAVFYLKKLGFLSWMGIKRKWRYLLTLYGVTFLVNLLFFMVVFPVMANFSQNNSNESQKLVQSSGGYLSLMTLEVAIPCPGHATLIISELKKLPGVMSVNFKFPNLFEVVYNQEKTSKKEILDLEIFQTFKVKTL